MQKRSLTLVWLVSVLFFAVSVNDAVAASPSEEHKSERVKIERSEAAGPEAKTAEEEAAAEAETLRPEKAAEQVKTEQGKKTGKAAKPSGKAKPQVDTDSMQKDALSLIGEKEHYYKRKGRPDPFQPFVSHAEPKAQGEGQKKLQRRKPQTPLERITLGQLRLTAVMETGGQNLALVEEASGKGYVVKEGTYIGDQGGRITKILPEALVIEEKYLDVFGNIAVRKKEMKLQK